MARKTLLLTAVALAATISGCSFVDLVEIGPSTAAAAIHLLVVENDSVTIEGQIQIQSGTDESGRIRKITDPVIHIGSRELAPVNINGQGHLYEVSIRLDATPDTLLIRLPAISGAGGPVVVAIPIQKRPGPFLQMVTGDSLVINLPDPVQTTNETPWRFELAATCEPRKGEFLSIIGRTALPPQLVFPISLVGLLQMDRFEACLESVYRRSDDQTQYQQSLQIVFNTVWSIAIQGRN
jgi:hypothetical protein